MKNGFSNQNFGYEYFHEIKLFRCIPKVDQICSYEWNDDYTTDAIIKA